LTSNPAFDRWLVKARAVASSPWTCGQPSEGRTPSHAPLTRSVRQAGSAGDGGRHGSRASTIGPDARTSPGRGDGWQECAEKRSTDVPPRPGSTPARSGWRALGSERRAVARASDWPAGRSRRTRGSTRWSPVRILGRAPPMTTSDADGHSVCGRPDDTSSSGGVVRSALTFVEGDEAGSRRGPRRTEDPATAKAFPEVVGVGFGWPRSKQ